MSWQIEEYLSEDNFQEFFNCKFNVYANGHTFLSTQGTYKGVPIDYISINIQTQMAHYVLEYMVDGNLDYYLKMSDKQIKILQEYIKLSKL